VVMVTSTSMAYGREIFVNVQKLAGFRVANWHSLFVFRVCNRPHEFYYWNFISNKTSINKWKSFNVHLFMEMLRCNREGCAVIGWLLLSKISPPFIAWPFDAR
jgi:hypothetical protein